MATTAINIIYSFFIDPYFRDGQNIHLDATLKTNQPDGLYA